MNNGPLSGLRMVDFTRSQAGPMGTVLLADMGMEVIRVESAKRHDFMRFLPPHPMGKPDLNRAPYFAVMSRGKRSIALDVSQPKGLNVAKRLVKISDVVMDNFTPRVMTNLGLGYEELKKVKPDIIALSLSGFGFTGPCRDYAAYAKPVQAFAGLLSITGYDDGPAMEPAPAFGDNIAGTSAAFAILSAIYHRDVTGEGQFIDVAMTEALICCIPEAVMEYTMNKEVGSRMGNRDSTMAPHGVYRCQGEDEWIAIAVSNDQEWQTLCQVISKPELVEDGRFRDNLIRWSNQDKLDEIISEWTKDRDKYEVMEMLQEAGVPAGPVLSTKDMLADPHLNERGYWVEHEHPGLGKWKLGGPTWKLSETPGGIQRHAPFFGQDNDYVYGELLGISKDEIANLVEKKVIY